MTTDGQDYLKELANLPPNTFESRFSKISSRLGLGRVLERAELAKLYEAAFCAALCNIAMNGLGGCGGQIKPEQEGNRIRLEQEFMAAREALEETPGWERLKRAQRGSAERIFLSVFVADTNLAW